MGYRVGVDIGGSFTDFSAISEETGEVKTLKVFSRPDQPGAEILNGLSMLQQRHGITLSDVVYFTHGTTVGVNTVVQRKGLKLALLTTENFGDVLELARLRQPQMFNLLSKRPDPLISRDMVFGIAERVTADGDIEVPLDEESVLAAAHRAVASGAEGVVIALLHAYRNGEHEKQARAIIEKAFPALPTVTSHEVWPIIREYERTITATISGYVQPRVAHYLGSLQQALKDAGVAAEARVTKSNGGVMSAEQGKTDCVQMILSGTASGVIGARYVAEMCGLNRCMSLDIGGTTADVALVNDFRPQYGVGEFIGDFQIFIPSVSVSSIGEGGGSIAWVDPLSVLKVGPESAGSTPGPACYGRGGTRPTITDAFVACGYVGAFDLGYKSVQIDKEKARAAIGSLAEQLDKSVEETAEAIICIAVSGMFSKISAITTRFGADPREYALLAFGGAGPMLGCFLGRELRMNEVVVPPTPGVLSALGGLIADIKNDFIKTIYVSLEPGCMTQIAAEFDELKKRATKWLSQEQSFTDSTSLIYSADMRYRGQSFEIEVEIPETAIETGDLDAVIAAFHDAHQRIYGHADRDAAVQMLSVRLVAVGHTRKPQIPEIEASAAVPTPVSEVEVWVDGAFRTVPVYRRADLFATQSFAGPAVVAQDDCTTCVPPGCDVEVDRFGNLRIHLGEAR